MDTYQIYLCGGMSSVSLEEQSRWRKDIIGKIKYSNYDYDKNVSFFDPTSYYGFEEQQHKSEREVFEFDLYNLRKSDLVIANLNDPKSIGSAMEMMVAKEHGIPVIAYGAGDKEIHPWVLECCTRVCDDVKEVVSHVLDFYLR